MALFLHNWQKISLDPWVLECVQGFKIEFYASPRQEQLPRPLVFSLPEQNFIDSEVRALLEKNAICHSTLHPRGFCSNDFVVQKKGGGGRLVLNLREFNQFVIYRHFKMEGIHMLRDLLLERDWMVRLHLKDAYLSVPIFAPHRRFLKRSESVV